MTRTERTYCRLCEAGCGLVAHFDDAGALDQLRPDHDHPVTAGFACNKGLLSLDIHRDPRRIDRPQRRSPDGTWTEVDWDEALDDIADRLRAILDRHGPSAFGMYLGNPTAFNATAGPAAGLFLLLTGSDRIFTAGSQDCSNKFAIGELLWGSAQTHLIPDVDHTDHLLLLGTNPRVSKGSFLAMPDPVARLASIVARGGVVRFVDPRHSEPRVGETVQIKPDTDIYLLAAMLAEIDRSIGFDASGAAMIEHLDELRAFVGRFPPELVAPVVGIETERIISMAREFAAAPSASAHLSTGVNMGRQGALAYWLLHVLVIVTGNFDRRGGNIGVSRATPPAPRSHAPDAGGFVETAWGTYRPNAGGHPGALLGAMFGDETAPIRAFISLAGNPALSMGGGPELAERFDSLELLVTIDYYRNATGDLADYVLPACDWFEREDLNTFVQGTQPEPFVQWAGPLVEPRGERRTERQIFTELADRLGLPPAIPADADLLAMLYDHALAEHGISMQTLRERDGGIAVLDPVAPGSFLARLGLGPTIDGDPEMLAPARQRAVDLFAELEAEPADQLKLITRRTSHTINSALDVGQLKRGVASEAPLYVHPIDAGRLGVSDGAAVRVSNRHGEVATTVRVDETLRPGVVAMTHGFGSTTDRAAGTNVNALAPTGAGTFDPVSAMSQLTGIPVVVEPLG